MLSINGASKNDLIVGCGGILRGCTGEWLRDFARYLSSYRAYIAKFWSVREGLRLSNTFGFQAIELHIDFKVVIKNILDYKQGSIIGMRLVQQIQ